jgi:hypothetical protein
LLADQWAVALTTYRRDGTAVSTPVNIAVDRDRAYVRSYEHAGKIKRIRNGSDVAVAPSTVRGRVTGPAIRARARILKGTESVEAGRLIGRKHRIFQGVVVPLAHRIARCRTVHLELTPM